MKKLVSALLALLLTLSVCAFADGETVRVVALNGPTGMGMVKMIPAISSRWKARRT